MQKNYHFIRFDGYCSCCVFNYKTIIIKATDEVDLVSKILNTDEIRKEFIPISMNNGKYIDKDIDSDGDDLIQYAFFDSSFERESDDHSLDALMDWYMGEESHDFLGEMIENSGESELIYMGE